MDNKIKLKEAKKMINKKYFTIHSLVALKNRSYSIFRANIDNTIEKVQLAKSLYNDIEFMFEYHNEKKCMKIVIN